MKEACLTGIPEGIKSKDYLCYNGARKPGVPGMPGYGGCKGHVRLSVVVVSPSAADAATTHMTIATKLNQGSATNYITSLQTWCIQCQSLYCIFYLEQ